MLVPEVLKKTGQVMWTAKAHNGRVILEWINHVMTDFASKRPDDGRAALLASCACLCYEQFPGRWFWFCLFFWGYILFQPPTLGFDRFLWFFLKHAWAVRLHWQDACCALLGAQWTVQEGSHSRTRGYFIWYWLQVLQKVYHPLQGCYQARLVWGNLG